MASDISKAIISLVESVSTFHYAAQHSEEDATDILKDELVLRSAASLDEAIQKAIREEAMNILSDQAKNQGATKAGSGTPG